MAAESLDAAELAVGVDPLGDDLQIEGPPELHHHAQQNQIRPLVLEDRDERPVDLELVDRQLLQVGQRAVSRAEVVERDADAERLQLVEEGDGLVRIVDQHRLGDLEPEELGRESALAQRARYGFDDRRAVELARRDVDRDTHTRCD